MKIFELISRLFFPIRIGDYIRFRNGRYGPAKDYSPRFDIGEVLEMQQVDTGYVKLIVQHVDRSKQQELIVGINDVTVISLEKMMLRKLEN
jgi:hypothetical protein